MRGHVYALRALVLGEVPGQQARGPGTLDRVLPVGLPMPGHDAAEMGVCGHEADGGEPETGGRLELLQGRAVERQEVLAAGQRAGRGGVEPGAGDQMPRGGRQAHEASCATECAYPEVGSGCGTHRRRHGFADDPVGLLTALERIHDLFQMASEPSCPQRRRARDDDVTLRQGALLALLAAPAPADAGAFAGDIDAGKPDGDEGGDEHGGNLTPGVDAPPEPAQQ